jgi:hypothetical protein
MATQEHPWSSPHFWTQDMDVSLVPDQHWMSHPEHLGSLMHAQISEGGLAALP